MTESEPQRFRIPFGRRGALARPIMRMRGWLLLTIGLQAGELLAHPESEVAVAELTRWIERTPQQPSLWFARSVHHRDHGRWDAAEADLVATERLAPHHPGLDLAFAQVFLETRRWAKARQRAERVLAEDDRAAAAHLLKARACSRLGDTHQARASYSRALSLLDEPTPELFLERTALPATVEVRLAELEEAMARVGAAHVLMLKALELEIAAGRTEAALGRIDRLAAHSERQETWLKRKGDLLAASGRPNEARLAYRQSRAAIAALPDWLQKSPTLLGLVDDLQRAQEKLPLIQHP